MWPAVRAQLQEHLQTIKVGDVRDFQNLMGAVIDAKAYAKLKDNADFKKAYLKANGLKKLPKDFSGEDAKNAVVNAENARSADRSRSRAHARRRRGLHARRRAGPRRPQAVERLKAAERRDYLY